MAKAKIELAKTLTNDLRMFRSTWVKEAAIIARDELVETAKGAILDFYKDYTPTAYQRHYYNFLTKSFRPLYKNNHGVSYSGGIYITLEDLSQIYEADAMVVGEQVYAGEHGHWETLNTDLPTPVMTPSPMEIILNKQREIEQDFSTGGSRWWRAYSAAISMPYTMISFN